MPVKRAPLGFEIGDASLFLLAIMKIKTLYADTSFFWECISNFIPHFIMVVITYPCRGGWKLIHVSDMGPTSLQGAVWWTLWAEEASKDWNFFKFQTSFLCGYNPIYSWSHFCGHQSTLIGTCRLLFCVVIIPYTVGVISVAIYLHSLAPGRCCCNLISIIFKLTSRIDFLSNPWKIDLM